MTFSIRRIIEDYVRRPPYTQSKHFSVDDDNDRYILFVDFAKTYDTVPRRVLYYYVLWEKYKIPENVVYD